MSRYLRPWSVIDNEELRLLRALEEACEGLLGPQRPGLRVALQNLDEFRERLKRAETERQENPYGIELPELTDFEEIHE